jgi:hypothetical protein
MIPFTSTTSLVGFPKLGVKSDECKQVGKKENKRTSVEEEMKNGK